MPDEGMCPPSQHWDSITQSCVNTNSGGGVANPNPGGGYGYGNCPPGQVSGPTPSGCMPANGDLTKGPCPGGESREESSGLCLCPGGQCRDIVSKTCREPHNGEQQNWTDDIERPTGGGRGYCRPKDSGWQALGAGGGGAMSTTGGFDDIWQQIQGMLNTKSRYTPKVMGQLTGQAKAREQSQNTVAMNTANADMARRGIFQSPVAAALAQKAKAPAAEGFNKAVSDLNIAKVNADAQDKMFAVQAAMQWVQMQMQGRQFDANLALAYQRLQQEWAMLQAQLSDPYRLLSGVV